MRPRGWNESLTAIAAGSSAVAAFCSLTVSCRERPTPYKAALYAARLNCIENYAMAASDFQATVLELMSITPVEIDTKNGLYSLNDKQMATIGERTKVIVGAWRSYLNAQNGAVSLWSIDTYTQFDRARSSGHLASDCFRVFASPPSVLETEQSHWRKVKVQAVSKCAGIHRGYAAGLFDVTSDVVLRYMTNELRDDSDQFVPSEIHNATD